MRPGSAAPLLRLTLAAALAAAANPLLPDRAAAEPGSAPPGWIRIDAPAPGERVRAPLVEVRGQALPRGGVGHDLVIALDVSDSALLASGWDLDGDGPGGRTSAALRDRYAGSPALRARAAESDLDDSVLMAELAAAAALIDRLDLRRDRVGLVAFSDDATLVAPLGSGRAELHAALAGVRDAPERWLRGTNLGNAIAIAQRALVPEPAAGAAVAPRAVAGRGRAVLLLSDGESTLPPGRGRAQAHALFAANAAAADGIRVHAFALGARDATTGGEEPFAALAEATGGRFERLARAGDAIARLRRTDLAGLASLRIVNATRGEPARALRTFPDGRFDGFVALAPGSNRIVVEAAADEGSRDATALDVVLDDAAPASPEEARADRAHAEALLEELRRRTAETRLWVEMERERRARGLELELSVEAPAAR